jgi:hypothetical protein
MLQIAPAARGERRSMIERLRSGLAVRIRAHAWMLTMTLLWGVGGLHAASAADSAYHRQVDGLSIYLGVLPAALVERRHPGTEIAGHGRSPRGHQVYHLMVAVFDEESGERVEDLDVEARVIPLGGPAVSRPLEPMTIGDTVTYGNYFDMAAPGPHEVRVSLLRPGRARPSIVEFPYDHRPQ